jgi:anti-sigma-K factor RskA
MNPQLEELACLYVLDRLDPHERAAVEARLPRDPELAALVRELELSLESRIRALAPVEPAAGLLERIESRIDREERMSAAAQLRTPAPIWASFARWGIAALIAVSLGTLAVEYLRRGPAAGQPYVIIVGLDSRSSALALVPLQVRSQDADASFMQLASLAERYWEKPGDLPVKLPSSGQAGHGYALFDPASHQGFIAIKQLPAVEEGKRYHLWILDTASGRVRDAGVLPLAGSSTGLYSFSVTPDLVTKPDHMGFFVTAEDTARSGAGLPSGKVVLGDRSPF